MLGIGYTDKYPHGGPCSGIDRDAVMPWRAKYIVAVYTAPFLYALCVDIVYYLPLVESAARRLRVGNTRP